MIREFGLTILPDSLCFQNQLAARINHFIQNDFTGLINILYRVDIDELKLKQALQANPGEDAGQIIAKLIIERQLQKIETREKLRRDSNIDEEEKW